MKPDQLLERMLAFSKSDECPPDRKVQVFNNAYKCWADSLTEKNQFAYDKVKNEKFTMRDCIKWGFDPDKISKIDISLQPNKPIKEYTRKQDITETINKHRKKKVIDLNTMNIYDSCRDAAKDNNLVVQKLNKSLLNKYKRPQLTNFAYLSDYESENFKQRIPYEKSIKKVNLNSRFNAKKIFDLYTGKTYDSLSIYCYQNGMQISSISRFLKTKNRNYLPIKLRESLNIMYLSDYQLLNKTNEKANQ